MTRATALLCALLTFGFMAPVMAQSNDKHSRILDQQAMITGLKSQLNGNVDRTKSLIEQFKNSEVANEENVLTALFDGIEADTRQMLASISLTSDFQDALDDMRAQIDTLIDRNERIPAGDARRDLRLGQLYELRETYIAQYETIQDMESSLTRRLGELSTERQQAMLDSQVDGVRAIVAALQGVVNNLTTLDNQLSAITSAVYEAPEAVAQN